MKKLNNKILVVAFIGLVLIFVLTKLYRSPARESNMDVSLFQVDTATITEIRLLPQKDSMTEIKLVRKGNQWNAIRKNVQAEVPPHKIKDLLETIQHLKPERIVTRKRDKWDEYQVSDSSATAVTILREGDELLQLKVGKENGSTTYVRTTERDEVYVLEGDLQGSFNTTFSEWRNQSFLRLTKNFINKIEFQYPGDSSFILEKQNRQWMIGNEPVDSAKVDAYLSKISHKDHTVFADQFSPAREPDVTVLFKSSANEDVVVKGWRQSFYQWVLQSDLHPRVYFLDQGPVLAPEVFAWKKQYLNRR